MSDNQNSHIILIDADSFHAAPKGKEEAMQNAFLIEFCIKAIEHGYHISILYNNQKRDISAQRARNNAIEGIRQGVLANSAISRYPATNPNVLIEALVPYGEYHAPDLNPTNAKKLDDAVMIVSPYPQETYQMLVGAFKLFVPTSTIDNFSAFALQQRKLNSGPNAHIHNSAIASFQAAAYLHIILNEITITNALQDAIEPEEAQKFLQDPRLTSFSNGEPKDLRLTRDSTPLSKHEFLLHNYFASLIRSQACPNRAKEAIQDAKDTLEALRRIRGGRDAAQAIEEFVQKNVHHRPSHF